MKILICDDDLMFAQAVHDRLLEFCSKMCIRDRLVAQRVESIGPGAALRVRDGRHVVIGVVAEIKAVAVGVDGGHEMCIRDRWWKGCGLNLISGNQVQEIFCRDVEFGLMLF